MSQLERHLEQILLSAESIATLPFPPQKIFTNAILHTPDITSLIRDTEPHERALFSVLAPEQRVSASQPDPIPSTRRNTVFNVAHGEVTAPRPSVRAPRRNTAVAAVLGPELHREMKKTENRLNGEIDVEVLLRGVEKLNAVYSLPGVVEKVQDLRIRFAQASNAVPQYEDKVERQTNELEKMNRSSQNIDEEIDKNSSDADSPIEGTTIFNKVISDEDIKREENEIKELENRRQELQNSIRRMEKDLGGLLR